jgi:hypothetical protein
LIKSLFVCLAASLLAATCFAADDPGDTSIIPHLGKKKSADGASKDKKEPKKLVSSSVKISAAPLPRIWIGLTGSITPLKLLKASTTGLFNANTGETVISKPSEGMLGGGLTVNARLFKSYWLSVGAVYRFTGYDWTYATGDTNQDVFTERSRIRMIDIPVLVRYSGKKWNLNKHTFYELGGTYRDGISRKTTTNWTDFRNVSLGSGIDSKTVYHRTNYGATAGVGFVARDDFGIIVSPEVRYTRWMGNTLSDTLSGSSLLGTQRNQLEVTISFGF